MDSCSHLPAWVSYFQALAVPLFAFVVGFFGLLISRRQAQVAHYKLQQDIFDRQWERRFAVYVATRDFLASAYSGSLSETDAHTYVLRALEAQFLFDDTMYRYLKDIHLHATTLRSATLSMEELPSGAEREAQARIRSRELDWIRQQGDGITDFSVRFAPF